MLRTNLLRAGRRLQRANALCESCDFKFQQAHMQHKLDAAQLQHELAIAKNKLTTAHECIGIATGLTVVTFLFGFGLAL